MLGGEVFGVRKCFYIWRCKRLRIWEKSEIYLSQSFFVSIYFNSCFYITKLISNHPKLTDIITQKKTSKLLYRWIHPQKHPSLPKLYYKLKYKYPKTYLPITLQVFDAPFVTQGRLEVLKPGSKYGLHLKFKCSHFKKSSSPSNLFKSYITIPVYYRDMAYQMYDYLHNTDLATKTTIKEQISFFPLSTSRLYSVFKNVIGVSPNIVKRDRQLLAFKRDLLTTNLPIVNLYQNTGFKSRSHLHRIFQNTFESTPQEFRNTYRRKHT